MTADNYLKCKNPLGKYPHSILESKSINQRVMDRLGYCPVCSVLAFMDNAYSSMPSISKHKREENITFASNDTL